MWVIIKLGINMFLAIASSSAMVRISGSCSRVCVRYSVASSASCFASLSACACSKSFCAFCDSLSTGEEPSESVSASTPSSALATASAMVFYTFPNLRSKGALIFKIKNIHALLPGLIVVVLPSSISLHQKFHAFLVSCECCPVRA